MTGLPVHLKSHTPRPFFFNAMVKFVGWIWEKETSLFCCNQSQMSSIPTILDKPRTKAGRSHKPAPMKVIVSFLLQERILNNPYEPSMQWITYCKVTFDWNAVVSKHMKNWKIGIFFVHFCSLYVDGFTTEEKSFLHNFRTK